MKLFIRYNYLFSFFCVLSLFIWKLPSSLNSNNAVYALEQINMYDSSIFANNIAVSQSVFSPRFFMNMLVSSIMKLNGGNWTSATLILIYFSAIILAFACVNIAFSFTKRYCVSASIIFSVFIAFSINSHYPGWGSFEIPSIGLGGGFAFSMLALSLVVGTKKRWNLAFIFLSFATLFHIHEGIWGATTICTLLLYDTIINKNFSIKKIFSKIKIGFPIFITILLVSAMLGIMGSSGTISVQDFKNIYISRVSHHIFPQAWRLLYKAKYFSLILFAAILRLQTLYYLDRKKCKNFFILSSLFIISWLLVLFVAYITTSVRVCPIVATMYITKYFRYIAIISIIWCLRTIINWLESKEWLIAISIFLTICFSNVLPFNLIIYPYLMVYFFINLYKGYNVKYVKFLFIALVILIFLQTSDRYFITFLCIAAFLSLILFCHKNEYLKILSSNIILLLVISITLLSYTSYKKIWNRYNGRIEIINSKEYLTNAVGKEFFRLAKRFERKTKKNEMFVGHPTDGDKTAWFQLLSYRNTFSSRKVLPSDMGRLVEWDKGIKRTIKMFDKNTGIKKIKRFLNRHNIKYVLLNKELYEKFDKSSYFDVFVSSYDDSYKIYYLKSDK
ncbi:MAG: hypothetical protein ACOX3T_05815 [Bdellovibrionota bacterium]